MKSGSDYRKLEADSGPAQRINGAMRAVDTYPELLELSQHSEADAVELAQMNQYARFWQAFIFFPTSYGAASVADFLCGTLQREPRSESRTTETASESGKELYAQGVVGTEIVSHTARSGEVAPGNAHLVRERGKYNLRAS